jgi:hypothetical protein
MKLSEKLNYLQENHFSEWLRVKQETENELSEKQGTWCVCGRLATGLHERNCTKLRNKVISETVKKMECLFVEK